MANFRYPITEIRGWETSVYRWGTLAVAVSAEVAGSLALKAATTQPLWSILTAIGYLTAFGLLTVLLRSGEPIGVLYGLWAALGVVLTAGLGTLVFAEPFTLPMATGIVAVVVGVWLIETGTDLAEPAAAGD